MENTNVSETVDVEYFRAIARLSQEKEGIKQDERTVFVSEITYCEKRRKLGIAPSMVVGIERDVGVKALLRKVDLNMQKEIYELLKRRWKLSKEELERLRELARKVAEEEGTETMIFIAPERNDKVLTREVEINGEKYVLMGSPDFVAVNLKPLKFKDYEIPELSPIPVEKKTGRISNKQYHTEKYKTAVTQAMIYAWMLNAPAFIVQTDWTRYSEGEYFTVSNDLYVFLPFYDEERRKSFEARLKKRMMLVLASRGGERETWITECKNVPLAGLNVYALKTSTGKRKDEEEVIVALLNEGIAIAKKDGLSLVGTLSDIINEIKDQRKEITPAQMRAIILRVAEEIQDREGSSFVEYERLARDVASVLECLRRKGYVIDSIMEKKVTDPGELRTWIETNVSRTGAIEVFNSGIRVIEQKDKPPSSAAPCLP